MLNIKLSSHFLLLLAPSIPMYNLNQFTSPLQPPIMAFTPHQNQLASAPQMTYATPDQNSNLQQHFQSANTQFNVSAPLMQTTESYPQVQTQINLQGMPPLTVNTPRIDPTKYSVP